MDPDANIAKQIELAKFILQETQRSVLPVAELIEAAESLAEHVAALDEWIMKGGALPSRWNKKTEGETS